MNRNRCPNTTVGVSLRFKDLEVDRFTIRCVRTEGPRMIGKLSQVIHRLVDFALLTLSKSISVDGMDWGFL